MYQHFFIGMRWSTSKAMRIDVMGLLQDLMCEPIRIKSKRMSVVYEGLTRSQESSPNCFVLLAIRQEKAFTQSGILQCLHYKVARVFRQSAYDVKERVPQLRLCTLVVLGGTSVRTWLAQWRALLMETLALKKKHQWLAIIIFMNFRWFNLHLVIHDLVHTHIFCSHG